MLFIYTNIRSILKNTFRYFPFAKIYPRCKIVKTTSLEFWFFNSVCHLYFGDMLSWPLCLEGPTVHYSRKKRFDGERKSIKSRFYVASVPCGIFQNYCWGWVERVDRGCVGVGDSFCSRRKFILLLNDHVQIYVHMYVDIFGDVFAKFISLQFFFTRLCFVCDRRFMNSR